MTERFEAKVRQTRPAAAGLIELGLDVRGTGVEESYRRPGQYVALGAPGGEEALFAIASPPGGREGRLAFLIKRGSPTADALAALGPGQLVRISRAGGPGFPIELAEGKDVLLFATGSGIGAVRSVVGVLVRDRRRYGKITLYFGARTPDAFAYAHEFDTWRSAGIDVVPTVSRPGSSGWEGLTGYVQSHVPEGRLDQEVAFVCGQRDMVRGVTRALVARGLPAQRVYLNF